MPQNMVASKEIVPTGGDGGPNCLSSPAGGAASNGRKSASEEARGEAPATSAANCSQVSSDNENSSNHSASWSSSSRRGAQKRLEAAQKLNLILPQQQQQQQQPPSHQQQQSQQKNCLSTPIVITSDDLHLGPGQQQQQQSLGQFYPSASQQMLFDSLAHQLNAQGAEVSLFTGLPSCTPTSADRLTGINPFFLHATNASAASNSNQTDNNQHSSDQLAHNGNDRLEQMRSSWLEQNGAAGHALNNQDKSAASKQSLAAAAAAAAAAAGYNANNYNLQLGNHNHHLDQHQRAKLTIADLQAANAALSPIMLSPSLSFLGLSPEQEALLRYGYVSPQQHPLAGRGFTQNDLNQLNHHHQVYHLNQIYHGQRAEPISTHHYNAHQQQQQISHQALQPANNHHHQPQHHQQQQRQAQPSYHHDHHQQLHQQQRQSQAAKDLIIQPNSTSMVAPSPTPNTTTGQISNQHAVRANASQLVQQQHHHLPRPYASQIINGGVINHAGAQLERHFGAVGGEMSRDRPEEQTRQLVDGGSSSGPAAAVLPVLARSVGDQQVAMVAPGRPAQASSAPRDAEQLMIVTSVEQLPAPQQSGLLLMPAAAMGADGAMNPVPPLHQPLATTTTTTSNSFVAAHGVAAPIRPAIILHEPTQPAPNLTLASSPSSRRSVYASPHNQDQTREFLAKSSKQSGCQSALQQPVLDNAPAHTGATNEVASLRVNPIELTGATVTNMPTCNELSRSPATCLAIDRPNSRDNLVSEAPEMVVEGESVQGLGGCSDGVKMKANKQKKLSKRADEPVAMQTTTTTTTTIQRDLDGNELPPVKKKSRGGRKKKLITHEEMLARKNRSKERNRVAARRCRQKRKNYLDELRHEIDQLHEEKSRLRKENAMLKNELEAIKRHHNACGVS